MALQPVNLGTIPNDGTGDDPRAGISKVNANMVLLEATGVNGTDNVFNVTNLNVAEFKGGDVINDTIALGHAVSTTEVRFFLPISHFSDPVSITSVSTFIVTDMAGNIVIASVSSPQLLSISSNKLVAIRFTGQAGLTVDKPYTLVTGTNASEITVNF